MKQTAVEWLSNQIECFGNKHELQMSWNTLEELVEQAKEMEKQQIIEAHTFGYVIGGGNGDIYNCEEFYEQTYGGGE